jgi:serine/threonine protein phosphatase PrpC
VFDGHGGLEVAKLVEKVFVSQLKATKQYKEEKYK